MTLESQISSLTQRVGDLVDAVNTQMTAARSEIDVLRGMVAYDFVVSINLPETSRSSRSISGVLTKIGELRASNNNVQGVSVLVDSFEDSAPITIGLSDIEVKFKRHLEFEMSAGEHQFEVTGDRVTLFGGIYRYEGATDDISANKPIVSTGEMVEIRDFILIDGDSNIANAFVSGGNEIASESN